MFNWYVEDMKLLNMSRVGEGYDKAFACESEVSIEDKFEFVDRMQGGNLSYIVGLHKDYQEAIPSMKKDAKGNPTNYAKRAWVRANDTQGLICRKTDSYNDYGDFNILGHCGNLFAFPNRKGEVSLRCKDESAFVNTLFHNQLKKCKDKEYDLFYHQDKTAQYLASFEDKLYDHRIHRVELEEDFDIRVTLATKPSERNKVVVTNYSANYSEKQRKELSLEEVHQIDTTLVALDELKAKIEQAQQAYEEARLTVAEKIKSIIFCGMNQFSTIREFFAEKQAAKEGTVRQLIWKKTNPSPMNGQHIYLSGIENAVWFKKRGGTFNARCKNTVFEYPCGRSKIHPTEKNHKLLEELILDNSNPGDLVFDPCAGSGSHLLVARDNGRDFIGVELDEGYFKIAEGRLSGAI